MRVGATVLLNDQRCVQSYGWELFRPLGGLQGVMDSLEEYECDEVAIIRPVRESDTLARFEADVRALQRLKTLTPISFGGGIRGLTHLKLLKVLPIERLIFSSAFLCQDRNLLEEARSQFGRQAIQCFLPLRMAEDNRGVEVFRSSDATYIAIRDIDWRFIQSFANEIILCDMVAEGQSDRFNFNFLSNLPVEASKVILSGGVGKQTIKIANDKGLASVLVDNKVLHKEFAIRSYKNARKMF